MCWTLFQFQALQGMRNPIIHVSFQLHPRLCCSLPLSHSLLLSPYSHFPPSHPYFFPSPPFLPSFLSPSLISSLLPTLPLSHPLSPPFLLSSFLTLGEKAIDFLLKVGRWRFSLVLLKIEARVLLLRWVWGEAPLVESIDDIWEGGEGRIEGAVEWRLYKQYVMLHLPYIVYMLTS